MENVTSENFGSLTAKNSPPAAVEFSSEWCPACQRLKPVFAELEAEYEGKIGFAEADVNANQELAEKLGILSIPQIFLYKDGKEIDRIIGFVSKEELEEKLDKLL